MRAWNRTGSFGEIFAKSCISANDALAVMPRRKERARSGRRQRLGGPFERG